MPTASSFSLQAAGRRKVTSRYRHRLPPQHKYHPTRRCLRERTRSTICRSNLILTPHKLHLGFRRLLPEYVITGRVSRACLECCDYFGRNTFAAGSFRMVSRSRTCLVLSVGRRDESSTGREKHERQIHQTTVRPSATDAYCYCDDTDNTDHYNDDSRNVRPSVRMFDYSIGRRMRGRDFRPCTAAVHLQRMVS